MRRRSRTVDRLIADLGSESPDARWAAIDALWRLQLHWDRPPRPAVRQVEQVFRALAGMLRRDPEPRVRRAAAYALTCWFEPRIAPVLLPALDDAAEVSSVRSQAAEGIGNALDAGAGSRALRARAVAALRRGLADPSAEVRFWCVYALGMMKAIEARAEIEQLAATDDAACPDLWRVRDEAADVIAYWTAGKWPHRELAGRSSLGAGSAPVYRWTMNEALPGTWGARSDEEEDE
jgi:HEAT repeat protein